MLRHSLLTAKQHMTERVCLPGCVCSAVDARAAQLEADTNALGQREAQLLQALAAMQEELEEREADVEVAMADLEAREERVAADKNEVAVQKVGWLAVW